MVLEKVETQSLGNSVGSSCLQNHHPKHAFSDFGKMGVSTDASKTGDLDYKRYHKTEKC